VIEPHQGVIQETRLGERRVDQVAKQRELAELRQRVQQLEQELLQAGVPVGESAWPPREFYTAYYAMTGGVMGIIGAAVSLLANVVAAPLVGKSSFELIKVYLTFPMGARALSLSMENEALIIVLGICLYVGTGMLIGVPIYLVLSRVCGSRSTLSYRMLVAGVLGLAVWAINFYGILSWLQPMLFGGNWVTDPAILPPWVAAATHLLFGWTLALLYPWGQFTPYRPPS
jgi:hypothetical protein